MKAAAGAAYNRISHGRTGLYVPFHQLHLRMDVVRAGAVLLVEVNPNYPRTFGDTMVHISQVTALVESDRPILCVDPAPYTEVDATIGKYVPPW